MDDIDFVFPLVLGLDISSLTMALATIPSPVGAEAALADSIEAALRSLPHLSVERVGGTVVARTADGRAERVLVVGALGGTGTAEDDAVAYVEMGKLFGPGTADVKGGLAAMLKAAALSPAVRGRDATFVFYDRGSGTAAADGLERVAASRPELLVGDIAVVLAPLSAAAAGAGASLAHPLAQRLIELTELPATTPPDGQRATELAVFDRAGVPAIAFGPGDAAVAGTTAEFVRTAELSQSEYVLRESLA